MIGVGRGCVVRTRGSLVIGALPRARIGDGVRIEIARGAVGGEVSAIERKRVVVAPFGSIEGIAVGDRMSACAEVAGAVLGFAALGRAVDAAAAPIDGGPLLRGTRVRVARAAVPSPRRRRPVTTPFWTGVPAIDGLLTIGCGARVGIFGAPGAGKSTLLEMIATGARGDAVVLALVGERGREAQRWLERLDRRTTAVCATSDRSAAERVRAADLAMSQATYLRDRGFDVVLILDSLARYAAALRELRVALDEPAGRGGYPPAVWSDLAQFVERAGTGANGSVTLVATILCEGDELHDPIAEAARSLLDGHVTLSAELAARGYFPAVDVVASRSRTMGAVVPAEHAAGAQTVRAALALLAETKDVREAGLAGVPSPPLRAALAAQPALHEFLHGAAPRAPSETLRDLRSIAQMLAGENVAGRSRA